MSSVYFPKEKSSINVNDDEDDEDLYFSKNKRVKKDGVYRILRYMPSKNSPVYKKGFWKMFDNLYTQKEIDRVCDLYYQYGEIIKIKRNSNV